MRLDDDGLHLHQSDIKTYTQCPEQLRLKFIAAAAGESQTGDAAFVGTTTHAVIEHELLSDEPYGSLKEAQAYGAYAFLEGMEQMASKGTVYSRASFRTDSKALAALKPLVTSWYESTEREQLMSMQRSDYHVEHEFDSPFTVTPDGLTIYLAGRIDLIVNNEVLDWKTASSLQHYKEWEHQRWAPQPPIYLWAAAKSGLIVPDHSGDFTFRYKVLLKKAVPVPFETITVRKKVGSFTWIERICQNIAILMDHMGIENEWPLNDTSALCGPKWCPFWDNCKGAYIGEDWK